ncbi:MAG: site-2 protease family protein [Gammaproteobacteria bacterium]
MDELSLLQRIAVWALPVIFAITVHEVAHGWVARYLGDPTAMMLGRLTLNPLKHIDPVGTLLVPALMVMLSPFVFGWAKPVPVTSQNLKNPKRDMALVALAGPLANLSMAILWGLVIKLGFVLGSELGTAARFVVFMGIAGVSINIVLMVLNMLPIPPLDGGRVLSGLLPGPWSWQLNRLESVGFIIILLLLVTGVLGKILGPVVSMLQLALYNLLGL